MAHVAETTDPTAQRAQSQDLEEGAGKEPMSAAERPTPAAADGLDELAALYPPGQLPREHPRGYIDDTLATPPYHLLHRPPPPEVLAAARTKAVERRLVPAEGEPEERARADRPTRAKRAAEAKSKPKKR